MENKLKISGVYGDKVNLYLDGIISTKYGNTACIEKVDISTETIYTYMHGTFDFSRVSSSSPRNKKAIRHCVEDISNTCNRYIRVGSIILIEDVEHTIQEIILPDFKSKFDISIITDKTRVNISFIGDVLRIKSVFMPKTKRELFEEILQKHTRRHSHGVNVEVDEMYVDMEKLFSK